MRRRVEQHLVERVAGGQFVASPPPSPPPPSPPSIALPLALPLPLATSPTTSFAATSSKRRLAMIITVQATIVSDTTEGASSLLATLTTITPEQMTSGLGVTVTGDRYSPLVPMAHIILPMLTPHYHSTFSAPSTHSLPSTTLTPPSPHFLPPLLQFTLPSAPVHPISPPILPTAPTQASLSLSRSKRLTALPQPRP